MIIIIYLFFLPNFIIFIYSIPTRGREDSPAYVSIIFAITADSYMTGRLGRPNTNLLDIIRKDLTRKNLNNNFKNITDFEDVRFLALDRKEWKKLEDI